MSVSDDGERPAVEVLEDEGDGEPTEEEIKEYAEFLGIDPDTEPELLWIAREGVVAPVPAPWKACQEGDEVFYFNFESQASIWDHPMDSHFRELVDKERTKAGKPASPTADRGDDDNDKSFVSEAVESDLESSLASPSPSPSGTASSKAALKPLSGAVESDIQSAVASPSTSPSGAASAKSVAAAKPAIVEATALHATGDGADAADASFVSDAVDESVSSAEDDAERGVARTAGPIVQDTKSFISDVVTSEASFTPSKATQDTSSFVSDAVSHQAAQETSSFVSEAASREVEPEVPEPSSPTTAAVSKLNLKEQAALWNSMSGGADTPRSADSSRSSGSSPREKLPAAHSPSQSSGSHPGSVCSSPRSADGDEKPAAVPAQPATNATPVLSATPARASGSADVPAVVPARASADVPAVETAKSSVAKPVGIGGVAPPRSPTISPTAQPVENVRSPTLSASSSPVGGSYSGSARSPKSSGGGEVARPLRLDSPGGGLPQLSGSPKTSPNSNARPKPVLDHSGGGYSARSSNPSEVSEDFRSDWGIVTPPVSARSGTGVAGGTVDPGHSLEVSASMDTRSMDTDRSIGLLSDRKLSADYKGIEKTIQIVPKSWQELRVDLEVLAEALQGLQLIRLNQREYLKGVKLDT